MIRWQPKRLEIGSRKDRLKGAVGLATSVALGLLCAASNLKLKPLLVYNASASVPLGFYRVGPATTLKTGDLVLLETPKSVSEMADARRYIPKTVPMIKHIAAVPGDHVCTNSERILVNGSFAATRVLKDRQGRPLPWWAGCRTLKSGEVFLLNRTAPSSFDSRYFGPVGVASVIGRLRPL